MEENKIKVSVIMPVYKVEEYVGKAIESIQAQTLKDWEFLIVDEPTTGLDPEERVRIRNLLVDFAKGRTVLFSTHVVEDIAATCSNLAVMRKGTFLYTGTVQDLLNHAKGKIWMAAHL